MWNWHFPDNINHVENRGVWLSVLCSEGGVQLQFIKSLSFIIALSGILVITTCGEAEAVDKVATTNKGYVVQGGLTWMPASDSRKTWAGANAYCTNTAIDGQTGWRLPTQPELLALSASGAIDGHGWMVDITWSSTPTSADGYWGSLGGHYSVILGSGRDSISDDSDFRFVTCVR
jgi:hypothetical protein